MKYALAIIGLLSFLGGAALVEAGVYGAGVNPTQPVPRAAPAPTAAPVDPLPTTSRPTVLPTDLARYKAALEKEIIKELRAEYGAPGARGTVFIFFDPRQLTPAVVERMKLIQKEPGLATHYYTPPLGFDASFSLLDERWQKFFSTLEVRIDANNTLQNQAGVKALPAALYVPPQGFAHRQIYPLNDNLAAFYEALKNSTRLNQTTTP